MNKTTAINLCGGSVSATAKNLGITASAVSQWPEDSEGELPQSAERRVLAYMARKHLPAEMLSADATKAAA